MRRIVIKAIVGIVIGVIFAALIAEIGARVMVARGQLPDRMVADIFAAHPVGWALEPDLDAKILTTGGLITIETNGTGYRDRNYAATPPDGVARIAVLGDSFTLALETPQDDTYHAILESQAGAESEVLSFGVSGYGTQQQLLVYQHVARDFAPDTVLLVFYVGNDMTDNRGKPGHPRYTLQPDGTLELRGFPYKGEFDLPLVAGQRSTWLMRHSRLGLMIGVLARAGDTITERASAPNRSDAAQSGPKGKPKAGSCGYLIGENFPDPTPDDWAITEALLVALRDAVAADGAALKVAVVPTELQVQDDFSADFFAHCKLPEYVTWPDGYQQRLRAILEKHDIAYLDLLPPLRAAAESGEDLYFDGADVHWTPEGHAAVAEILGAWLSGE